MMTNQAPTVAARGTGRSWWVAQAALITLAVWFVYGGAVSGGWLWDDNTEIVENGLLRDPDGLAKIWFAPPGPDYFPLKTTVQWVAWKGFGAEPGGYHLLNIGLHGLSALLLWRLLGKLGVRLAWLGGLLFAVHPLAVESVAWVAELKNALSLPPLLLAMAAYVDFDERGRRKDYWQAVGWFLAAMLCKTSVVMLPVVILLFVWWKHGMVRKADIWASAPFFAISAALGVVTLWFQHTLAIGNTALALAPLSGVERIEGAGLAVWFYLGKSVLPVGLLPVYPHWQLNPAGVMVWLAWPALLGMPAWFWLRRAGWGRHALLGVGFFVVNLAPVLGLISMSYLVIAPVADHFVYISMVGVIGLVVAAVSAAWAGGREKWRVLAGVAVGVVSLALAWESRQYTAVFHEWDGLWSYVLEHNPASWLARYNLGNSLAQQKRYAEAVVEYQEAIGLEPRLARMHNNLGIVLEQLGREEEAVKEYREAQRLRPDLEFGINLGNALLALKRPAEARAQYEAVLHRYPESAEAHCNLANMLIGMGQTEAALGHYRLAVKAAPENAAIRLTYGEVLINLGRPDEAGKEIAAVLRLDAGNVRARADLAKLPDAGGGAATKINP